MRKPIMALATFIVACGMAFAQTDKIGTWAQTPPMGWNSWDCFGPSVVEDEVKANADYMAEHLLKYGWEYVVVDIRWFVDNQDNRHLSARRNTTSMSLTNGDATFLQ